MKKIGLLTVFTILSIANCTKNTQDISEAVTINKTGKVINGTIAKILENSKNQLVSNIGPVVTTPPRIAKTAPTVVIPPRLI